MKRLMIILAGTVSAPALAQHAGHSASPEPSTAEQAQSDPHAGHTMPAAEPAQAAEDPHAGHAMPAQPQPVTPPADPHAGHVMPAQPQPVTPPADPHAGHVMPATPAPPATTPVDPHAGHSMGSMGPSAATPREAPPPPEAFTGPEHAADLFYSDPAMARAREEMREKHGGIESYRILIDQLEARLRDGRDGYAWEADAWYGGDINKLWVKTEGEGGFGQSVESAEVQALWSRAINPWFDAQLGVRYDFRPDPERAYLVAGIQGLAPYWFEVDGTLFLSEKGDLSARFEGEYELRITQELILQPQVEVELALQDVPELGVGSGLSTAELGARLRYEFRPESGPAVIAPYIGVQYERAFGDTADFRRAEADDVGGWNLLVGLRTWF